MNQQQLTPREKLKAERLRLQQACLLQEQRLNEDFAYVQENAGSVLMSGLSMLLFPSNKSRTKEQKQTTVTTTQVPVSLGLSDYLSVAQSLLPVAWDVVRPLLTAWGIQKIQTWIIRKLFKKKR